MAELIDIYCDESCHLERDGQPAMVLGAVWCPDEKRREIAARVAEIRKKHRMRPDFEFKWTKVSPAKEAMYMDLVDYFFDDDDIKFRCLIVPDKGKLDHKKFGQKHDEWYYKMYFTMLKIILRPGSRYRIYIDIKDTKSNEKVQKLHDVLCNNAYDFSRKIIERVQQVRSNEVAQVQLADMLIGAMSYRFRGLDKSEAKGALLRRISKRSGYSLDRNTLLREEKFNIFVWHGGED